MISFITKSVVALAALQGALALPATVREQVAEVQKRAGGGINSVYFTNW